MPPRYLPGDHGQAMLAPVGIAELLPSDHDAFAYQRLVDELDLSAFHAAYRADGQGHPPYDPKPILTLILYCRSKRIVSVREVAAACYDDLGARLIMGNRHPDRSTIDRFLKTHDAAIKALLPQTLRIGYAEDLVDVSVVAGDGTYVQANAAMGATVDAEALTAQISKLQQQVATARQVWAQHAAASADTPVYTDTGLFDVDPAAPRGDRHDAAWRKVCTLSNLLRSRQQALAHLRSHPGRERERWQQQLHRDQQRVAACQQRLDAEKVNAAATDARRRDAGAVGRKLPGSVPKSIDDYAHVRRAKKALDTATARTQATAAQPPAGDRINTTDPTSAIMPAKSGGFDQLHNVQAFACKRQFIITIGTHPCSNDKQALVNLLQAGRANLDAAAISDPIGTALFDAGYASAANVTAELPVELLLVAVEKEARQTGRLHDDTHTAAAAWQAMVERLAEPDNRKLYKQRAAIIEPLFAQLFARFGRGINVRGDQVDVELHLWAVTHNLGKIIRHRRRKPRSG